MTEKYKLFTIFVMGFMYVFIGTKHFTDPQYFLEIVPPQLPFKLFLIYFTGLMEIIGGAAILLPKTRRGGAFLLMFTLVIVFPANIYLYISEDPQNALGVSKMDALIRMPFQIPLIVINRPSVGRFIIPLIHGRSDPASLTESQQSLSS